MVTYTIKKQIMTDSNTSTPLPPTIRSKDRRGQSVTNYNLGKLF